MNIIIWLFGTLMLLFLVGCTERLNTIEQPTEVPEQTASDKEPLILEGNTTSLCEDVICKPYCKGYTRYYSGKCDEITGGCLYDTERNSNICGYEEPRKEDSEKEATKNSACVLLGCSSDTVAVGSKNSDKWHYCSCRYADEIKKENLICFKSIQEAEMKGYTKTKVC